MTNSYQILTYHCLTNPQKSQTIDILIEGFGHLMNFSKDENVLRELFLHGVNEEYVYAYVEEGEVLGFVGIATNKVRPIKLEKEVCVRLFGKAKGSLLCGQMNAIFQSQVVKGDSDLYIDFLATKKEARGKGVATALLNYCFEMPRYETCYIEVLSKNENAKRLYEKIGFQIYKKQPLSVLTLRGYGYPIKMKKERQ